MQIKTHVEDLDSSACWKKSLSPILPVHPSGGTGRGMMGMVEKQMAAIGVATYGEDAADALPLEDAQPSAAASSADTSPRPAAAASSADTSPALLAIGNQYTNIQCKLVQTDSVEDVIAKLQSFFNVNCEAQVLEQLTRTSIDAFVKMHAVTTDCGPDIKACNQRSKIRN